MIEQRSQEWFRLRAGAFTASRAADLMARLKNGAPGASYHNLIALLAVERLTGECVETFQNEAMRRGIEMEGEALDAYAFSTMAVIDAVAFIPHPDMPRVGCSPDGLVGSDGLVEVKCPSSMQKHLGALESGAHATEYRWQLQHQLFVTGRDWVDAVSYDPRFPPRLRLAVKRVFRSAKDCEAIKAAIYEADAIVEDRVAVLQRLEADAA